MEKNQLKIYASKAEDIEEIGYDVLVMIIKNKKIILRNVNEKIKNEIYEIFGEKFRNKNKKQQLKVVWLKEEIDYLLNNYGIEDTGLLGKKLSKSDYQINLMLTKLKLFSKREWSEEELKFLRNNLEKSTIWLARKLNRSVASVKSKKRVIKNILN